VSVVIVSLISLIGIFTFALGSEKLKKILLLLVSFSAGVLLGDVFIHIIPEIDESQGFGVNSALYILLGIGIFFVLEKIVQWRHCHMPITKTHVHPVAYMNLLGDGLHNFLDGTIIAAGYIASIPVGIATTIAVVAHEIPQEIGDFGVLIHAGFTKKKAILFNFLSATLAIIGALIVVLIGDAIPGIESALLPIAAGGFVYIAGSDLIPELHKEFGVKKSLLEFLFFSLGIGIMLLLRILG